MHIEHIHQIHHIFIIFFWDRFLFLISHFVASSSSSSFYSLTSYPILLVDAYIFVDEHTKYNIIWMSHCIIKYHTMWYTIHNVYLVYLTQTRWKKKSPFKYERLQQQCREYTIHLYIGNVYSHTQTQTHTHTMNSGVVTTCVVVTSRIQFRLMRRLFYCGYEYELDRKFEMVRFQYTLTRTHPHTCRAHNTFIDNVRHYTHIFISHSE